MGNGTQAVPYIGISKYAYRLNTAPLLPPPQGEGDREAVEGVYLQ